MSLAHKLTKITYELSFPPSLYIALGCRSSCSMKYHIQYWLPTNTYCVFA